MHRLAKLDAKERHGAFSTGYATGDRRLGRGHVRARAFEQMMRAAFPEMPEDPTAEQVEGGSDNGLGFRTTGSSRCRQMAAARVPAKAGGGSATSNGQRDQVAFGWC